jgi:hypothetical protein
VLLAVVLQVLLPPSPLQVPAAAAAGCSGCCCCQWSCCIKAPAPTRPAGRHPCPPPPPCASHLAGCPAFMYATAFCTYCACRVRASASW